MSDPTQTFLRPWRPEDKPALLRYANNRKIWLNLKDKFPHPYTAADADAWLARCLQAEKVTNFAITLNAEAIGSVGLELLGDVYRLTAEIGYWLAEPFWGRGIATRAVTEATVYGFEKLGLARLQAEVFARNPASGRVLEKCGYRLEGRLHQKVFKADEILDSLLYARLRGNS